MERLEALREWGTGEAVYGSFAVPRCDDELGAELRDAIEGAMRDRPGEDDVPAWRLRWLVEAMPCCETEAIADELLARDAVELFAPGPDDPGEFSGSDSGSGWQRIGHGGVFAFLEVTRPQRFRQRLHEGLDRGDAAVRARCAWLSVAIGDAERLEALRPFFDEALTPDRPELRLARDRDPRVRGWLHERVAAEDATEDELAGSAIALGMPFEVGEAWQIEAAHVDEVRAALLAGDAVEALLVSGYEVAPRNFGAVLRWRQPRVTAVLRRWRASSSASVSELLAFDLAEAYAGEDAEAQRAASAPLRDGRYVTHAHEPMVRGAVRAEVRAEGLAALPFWIDQLGSNCCKVAAIAEPAMVEWFGRESFAYHRSKLLEPAAAELRRTLLPHVARLRWSRIAGGYVFAAGIAKRQP